MDRTETKRNIGYLARQSVNEVVRAAQSLASPGGLKFIETVALEMTHCFQRGGKILIAGNGGSLSDAMHFAEELTGQFRQRRAALAAISLSDPAHMSCVANDFGFEHVFSRGIEALGEKGDLFIGLSTSGNSPNLFHAVAQAKKKEMGTIAFLGRSGGTIKGLCDLEWIVSGFAHSDRVQEAHMAAIHVIIELVEYHLFSS